MSRLLDRAAAVFGIEAAFIDDSGKPRLTSPATKRALLAAMGVEAESDAGLREALARQARADLAPAVLVARAGEDAALSIPALSRSAAWQLTLESGDVLSGACRGQAVGPQNRLLLPAPLPAGYHRLVLERPDGRSDRIQLIAAPPRCLLPEDLGLPPLFGLGCRLGARHGPRDLAELAALAARAGEEGADFLAPGSLHAPSHRGCLDEHLIAPDLVPEIQEDPELAGLSADDAAARRALLERAFERFCRQQLGPSPSTRGAAFLAFRGAGGEALQRCALFEVLAEEAAASGAGRRPWWAWPEAWRRADGPGVQAFARERAERIAFFAWLQWLADEQLRACAARAHGHGMRLGLYRNLAIGADPAGAGTWSLPGVVARGVSIGAPPDSSNPKGRDWGMAPFAPQALAGLGFAPWIADLRASMRHAGVLQVDHVLGLRRLFWLPAGGSPADGAYVRYPFAILAVILALESHRARCLVVGEDLDTLPRGFRPALRRAGILSCRVFWLERERGGGFGARHRPRHASVAAVAAPDLPPLRDRLEAEQISQEQARDRGRLVRFLQRAGLLGIGDAADAEAIVLALHRWLARTPAALLLVRLEDLLPAAGAAEGEALLTTPFARRLFAMLRAERPRTPAARTEPQPSTSVLLGDGPGGSAGGGQDAGDRGFL